MIARTLRIPVLVVLFAGLGCGGESGTDTEALSRGLAKEEAAFDAGGLEEPEPSAPSTVEVGPGVDGALAAMERGLESTGRQSFERFRSEWFRAGLGALMRLVGADDLDPDGEDRAAAFLEGLLAETPPERAAWWGRSLAWQRRFEGRLGADPEDEEALEAWRVLRNHLDPQSPDLAGLRAAARDRGNASLAESAAEILLAAERLPLIDEGLRRDLDAVLLGVAVNRYRRDRGEWPPNIESIRPGTVPASPGGGRWQLDEDPETKRPAIFLRGGRRFGAAQTDTGGFHGPGVGKPLLGFE